MVDPTPQSAAERRLVRAHADNPLTVGDLREHQVDLERSLATLLADHPSITMSQLEVLEATEYDLDELRAAAADLYPARFGGDAADV